MNDFGPENRSVNAYRMADGPSGKTLLSLERIEADGRSNIAAITHNEQRQLTSMHLVLE